MEYESDFVISFAKRIDMVLCIAHRSNGSFDVKIIDVINHFLFGGKSICSNPATGARIVPGWTLGGFFHAPFFPLVVGLKGH